MDQSGQFSIDYILFSVATVLSFFNVNSSVLEKPIFKYLNKKTGKENALHAERLALKRSQETLSMVNDFAKYSKIQRKINAIEEELKEINGQKPSNSFLLQMWFKYGVKCVISLVTLILSVYYRNSPVLYLGDDISLSPFTYLISYNGGNCVSFYFWAMCCACTLRCVNQIKA